MGSLQPSGTASQTQSATQSATRSFYSRSHRAVIRVYDAGVLNRRSARAMQDGVSLTLLDFLQQGTDFRCGRRNELDTAPFRFR